VTLAQMIIEARYTLDETSAVAWTDAEITVYINHAQQEIASIISTFDEDWFTTSANATVTASVSTVSLPSDCIAVRRIEWINGDTTLSNPRRLQPIEWRDKGMGWAYYLLNLSVTGAPYYYFFQGSNLYLDPRPSATKVAALRIWYIKRLADLTGTDTSEIPAQWHKAIVLRSVIQACRKMEQDTAELQKDYDKYIKEMISELCRRQHEVSRTARDVWYD
jgi:hypothetical protein